MWQDGQDTNEDGVPVRLYQPILYSGRARESPSPTFSHVGGVPSYFQSDTVVNVQTPQCDSCKQKMYLLLQLYNPDTERTLYVFGCNRGSCVAATFEGSSQFSLGGGGRFVCRHSQPCGGTSSHSHTAAEVERESVTAENNTVESPWGSDEKVEVGGENDWDFSDGGDYTNIDDVEAMVAAMEMKGSKTTVEKGKRTLVAASSKKSPQASSSNTPCFPCYEIHGLQEPASRKSDDMDDDDVGMMGGTSNDDKKIQQMLARYMAEEEDEDIIAAIQGAAGGGGCRGGGRGGEKDERLPPEDRAMLAFTDRVKRAPRQIVRYAQGGTPLWSVPSPTETKKAAGKHQRGRKNGTIEGEKTNTLNIPSCRCGAERQFECQLMPNLLGILNVDKHARSKESKSSSQLKIDVLMSREYGGMNWGTIAVYTCKDNCEGNRIDYVIVQDSVDGNPEKRAGATDDAMVVDADKEGVKYQDMVDDDNDNDFDDQECD